MLDCIGGDCDKFRASRPFTDPCHWHRRAGAFFRNDMQVKLFLRSVLIALMGLLTLGCENQKRTTENKTEMKTSQTKDGKTTSETTTTVDTKTTTTPGAPGGGGTTVKKTTETTTETTK